MLIIEVWHFNIAIIPNIKKKQDGKMTHERIDIIIDIVVNIVYIAVGIDALVSGIKVNPC